MNLYLILGAVFCASLTASIYFYGFMGDPWAMFRMLARLGVVVPASIAMSILAVSLFDRATPPHRWIERVVQNETACAIVLAALLFGIFWLCVQG